MTDCEGCGTEFEIGDSVFECQECNKGYCGDCKDEHNCIVNPDGFNSINCEDCGIDGTVFTCPSCDARVCEDCIRQHCDNHKEDIAFEEQDYADWLKGKMVKVL